MKAIYAPYIPYVTKYASLEESHMQQQLATLKVSRDDLMDTVQGLSQSITSVMSVTNEALRRCLQFTEGCGFSGLIKALQVNPLSLYGILYIQYIALEKENRC